MKLQRASQKDRFWGMIVLWSLFIFYLIWFWNEPKANLIVHWIILLVLGMISLFSAGYYLVERRFNLGMEIQHRDLAYSDGSQIRRLGINSRRGGIL